jgi:hypothetical protein
MATLQPLALTPLPLRDIRPLGWLAGHLRLQADGLSGHLDEFWPDVRDSRWFGGSAEGWERAPYWLDGLIPLAFLLDDAGLKAKAERYVGYILEHQQADGWLAPGPVDPAYDLWGVFLMLKVLVEYHAATGDERIAPAVERCLRQVDRHIDRAPLFNWGQFRWFEALLPVFWLYERHPAPWLWDLAVKLQAQGFHWPAFFERWPLTTATPKERWSYMSHVVNNAMAVKGAGLWWRLSGSAGDRTAVFAMIDQLDRYHGQATGMFSGDECLAGRRPTQGTELCAVVEYAFSLEKLLSVFGDARLGDRLERVIFNALPATFSPDMWAHQYDQQVNQVECSHKPNRSWTTNGPESNLFGVEPNYGCCTANLSQGWPKFAAHLWMASADGGLAAVAYAPSRAAVTIQGVPVTVTLETEYPFREQLRFTVTVARSVTFPLHLRIPEWAADARLELNGAQTPVAPGTFHTLAREWTGTTTFTLNLPMRPRLTHGYNQAVAVQRGPLTYALQIGEDWRRVNTDQPGRELPHADWEVYPTTPWNYALDVSEATLAQDVVFDDAPLGALPFSPQGAPIRAHVRGRLLPDWQMENGSAADAPLSPVSSSEPLATLTLIPYGCSTLRVAEYPVLARSR